MTGPTRLSQGERIFEILKFLRTQPAAEITALAQQFGVTEMTIRNDLDWIAGVVSLRRGRGRVSLAGSLDPYEGSYYGHKARQHQEEKQLLASFLLDYRHVKAGDLLFMDAGSTLEELVLELRQRRVPGIRVISHSGALPMRFLSYQGADYCQLGGVLDQRAATFVDSDDRFYLENLGDFWTKVNREFLEAFGKGYRAIVTGTGYSVDNGLGTNSRTVVECKRNMLQAAKGAIVVLDGSKFEETAEYGVTHLGLRPDEWLTSDKEILLVVHARWPDEEPETFRALTNPKRTEGALIREATPESLPRDYQAIRVFETRLLAGAA